GLDLGSEQQRVVALRVKQRSDPGLVPRKHQLMLVPVVKSHGELAVQPTDEAGAVVLIHMDEDFDIAAGAETVTARFELPAQIAKIIDFAVADRDDRAVLVEVRLIAGGEIDNGKPAARQSNSVAEERAAIVRTAMGDPTSHG